MHYWKDIPDTNGQYQVNTIGEVKKVLPSGIEKYILGRIDRGGYITVRLHLHGKSHTRFVHRLVAETFIPNHLKKKFVNHINGIKIDNRLENLEWVSHSENIRHAFLSGLCKPYGRKITNDCSGELFDTIKEAADSIGISYGTCRNYLNGNIKRNKTCLRYAYRFVATIETRSFDKGLVNVWEDVWYV
jgi:hypothetical protein